MAENEVNATFEARIVMALEQSPEITIPDGFAARVASRLPARPTVVFRSHRYGFLAAQVCLALLFACMAVFARQTAAGSLYAVAIESILCLQFVLLTLWWLARSAGYTLPGGY